MHESTTAFDMTLQVELLHNPTYRSHPDVLRYWQLQQRKKNIQICPALQIFGHSNDRQCGLKILIYFHHIPNPNDSMMFCMYCPLLNQRNKHFSYSTNVVYRNKNETAFIENEHTYSVLHNIILLGLVARVATTDALYVCVCV